MTELYLTVSVDEDLDNIGEIDVTVTLDDAYSAKLASLVDEFRKEGNKLTEEEFQERLPDVYAFISEQVDELMPGEIDMDEGQDIDDFSWYIVYPDDICELFD